jgi:hypothetical protein
MRGMVSGWKEIASALNRSVRTVQRWERELRLPIHRFDKGGKTPVFAFENELQSWLVETTISVQSQNGLKRKPVQQIISLIQTFLTANSGEKSCHRCRSAMRHVDALFWLNGTKNQWKVSIPFCPCCEPDLLNSGQTIQ